MNPLDLRLLVRGQLEQIRVRGSADLLDHKLDLITAVRVLADRRRVVEAEIVLGEMADAKPVRRQRFLELAQQRRRRVKALVIGIEQGRRGALAFIEVFVWHEDTMMNPLTRNTRYHSRSATP